MSSLQFGRTVHYEGSYPKVMQTWPKPTGKSLVEAFSSQANGSDRVFYSGRQALPNIKAAKAFQGDISEYLTGPHINQFHVAAGAATGAALLGGGAYVAHKHKDEIHAAHLRASEKMYRVKSTRAAQFTGKTIGAYTVANGIALRTMGAPVKTSTPYIIGGALLYDYSGRRLGRNARVPRRI